MFFFKDSPSPAVRPIRLLYTRCLPLRLKASIFFFGMAVKVCSFNKLHAIWCPIKIKYNILLSCFFCALLRNLIPSNRKVTIFRCVPRKQTTSIYFSFVYASATHRIIRNPHQFFSDWVVDVIFCPRVLSSQLNVGDLHPFVIRIIMAFFHHGGAPKYRANYSFLAISISSISCVMHHFYAPKLSCISDLGCGQRVQTVDKIWR